MRLTASKVATPTPAWRRGSTSALIHLSPTSVTAWPDRASPRARCRAWISAPARATEPMTMSTLGVLEDIVEAAGGC